MKFYAEVINNFIRHTGHIFEDDFEVQYNPNVLTMVDISNIVPTPSQGDYYNVETGLHIATWDFPGLIDKTSLLADGVDSVVISGLPSLLNGGLSDTTVSIEGIGSYQVDDGTFEFSIDTPGAYQIRVESFPYLPVTYEVMVE